MNKANKSNKAIFLYQTGDESCLRWEYAPLAAELGEEEVVVRHEAVGINFIDIYHRTGLYPLNLPAVLGMEAAGIVEEVGKRVRDFHIGDRVAYCTSLGSYSQRRHIASGQLILLPTHISTKQAAAMMLKGMTAEYLIHRTFRVKRDHLVLFHAIAGGVGLIALQWLKQLGVFVIGTASTKEKAELARSYGCDEVIIHGEGDLAKQVRELTKGKGVDVVYDSIGKDTFMSSLDALRPRGMMVSYGNASGPVPPVAPSLLAEKGSLFLTRPSLMHYAASEGERRESAARLFAACRAGLEISIHQEYPLAQVARAHKDLAARKTTASTILIP